MNKSIASSILISLCLSTGAWAGSESGFYIGGSVGQSAVDVEVIDDVHLEDENTAYKILGGFNFGVVPFLDLAIEVDYRDFGEFEEEYTGADAGITSKDIFGLVGFNFGPGSVFGKLGYCDADLDVTAAKQHFKDSDSFTAYGIGAQLQLSSFSIRAEYENFDLEDVEDLSMFSIGGTLTF